MLHNIFNELYLLDYTGLIGMGRARWEAKGAGDLGPIRSSMGKSLLSRNQHFRALGLVELLLPMRTKLKNPKHNNNKTLLWSKEAGPKHPTANDSEGSSMNQKLFPACYAGQEKQVF